MDLSVSELYGGLESPPRVDRQKCPTIRKWL